MLNTISDFVSEGLVEKLHWCSYVIWTLNYRAVDSDRENQSRLTKNEAFAISQVGDSIKRVILGNSLLTRMDESSEDEDEKHSSLESV